jgi:hypothetical protein
MDRKDSLIQSYGKQLMMYLIAAGFSFGISYVLSSENVITRTYLNVQTLELSMSVILSLLCMCRLTGQAGEENPDIGEPYIWAFSLSAILLVLSSYLIIIISLIRCLIG